MNPRVNFQPELKFFITSDGVCMHARVCLIVLEGVTSFRVITLYLLCHKSRINVIFIHTRDGAIFIPPDGMI